MEVVYTSKKATREPEHGTLGKEMNGRGSHIIIFRFLPVVLQGCLYKIV